MELVGKRLPLRAWGTLDSEGRCIYTINYKENPLPIEAFRSVAKDVEDGRFHPDREKPSSHAPLEILKHPGRTRTTAGSKPWCIGFSAETKKYPDRSR
jgi:hypothetical protein